MNDHSAAASGYVPNLIGPPIYDPASPIMFTRRGSFAAAAMPRRNQRLRRAHILATIRQLLTEGGFESVTMRRIADVSGHAVQTIYNLVGPRDHAIVEAIGEYTRFVGRTARPDPQNPEALTAIIDRWLQSIAANPEFCRQVSLISFTPSRHVFYAFRDRQRKGMENLLVHQQQCGVLRADANVRDLAELLVLLSSALCVEWSDGNCSFELLHRRLYSGFAELLGGALARGEDAGHAAFSRQGLS